jgi:hypothetical protein
MVVMVIQFDSVMTVIVERITVMRLNDIVVNVALGMVTPQCNARHKQE